MLDTVIPPPDARGPLTWHSFILHVLPSLSLYYLAACLVVIPGTLRVRLALLPAALWSFFRTATHVDLVHGLQHRETLVYLNQGLLVCEPGLSQP
jgi:hypothetical protein